MMEAPETVYGYPMPPKGHPTRQLAEDQIAACARMAQACGLSVESTIEILQPSPTTDDRGRQTGRIDLVEKARQRIENLRGKLRRAMLRHGDPLRCCTCGTRNDLKIDHVQPIREGEANDLTNLQFPCHDCNAEKNHETRGARRQRRAS